MVKLDVEEDVRATQVANTEGKHSIFACKGGEGLVLCADCAGILVEGFMIDHMQVIVGMFALDLDLIATVLLDGLMEALYLVFRQVVVEANAGDTPQQ